ncbi:Cytochrome c556 [Thiothrix caldifontis]|jgi:Cytochrome c556|uniref:Cytochrome c556 n=1 Tax=Thiothrix caldifontis TaxID=525918 RepID=A0A1H4A9D9_9GAMM|nr:cytochrome c [Thiothrix caldifontis]SEA32556.1 Cytochrome c556 [Thiothrix caldifontis]
MNLLQKTLAIAIAATGFAVVTNVMADEKSPAEAAIDYRQGAFTMIKHHFGPMGAMVKGEMEFNAAEFAKNADAVAALSKFPANGFIAGSYEGETEAKPEIELNADDFKKKMETFQVEAAALAEVAKGGDIAAIKPQFGKVGESCKACHKEYKKD